MVPLSIIVPVLDEEPSIAATLRALAPMRAAGAEVLVVDGGSRDATRALAAPLADRVIGAARGRASQMNAGALASRGALLLFLHADTLLPAQAMAALARLAASGRAWGRFDVAIAGRSPLLAVVARLMNLRSRLTGIATGDQAIFVTRAQFDAVGGFPAIPLMEDVALSKALKRCSPPLCLRERVTTSGRRWERHGTLRTILLMWRLRLAYALGADPHRLARRYDAERAAS
jgi:rSAM/selenodomain-associated transferase 2